MQDKIFTFEDLQFKPHKGIPGGVHASLVFNNGYSISVAGGGEYNMLYGDGIDTFEAWASCDETPRAYLTKEEVNNYMKSVQLILEYDDPFAF
jgi:hypothetical protein